MTDSWAAQAAALGAFIRGQRELARLSLRQLAELTSLSHPYLSQVERGIHQPSVRVLKLISQALNLSAETILVQAGLLDEPGLLDEHGQGEHGHDEPDRAGLTEQVISLIRSDHRLTRAQQAALIAVYESMLELLATRCLASPTTWPYARSSGLSHTSTLPSRIVTTPCSKNCSARPDRAMTRWPVRLWRRARRVVLRVDGGARGQVPDDSGWLMSSWRSMTEIVAGLW